MALFNLYKLNGIRCIYIIQFIIVIKILYYFKLFYIWTQ